MTDESTDSGSTKNSRKIKSYAKTNFSRLLKSLRVKSDTAWTQESLAEEVGIAVRTYKGWENAEAIPSHEYLKQIVDLLHLNKEDEDALYRAALQVPPIIDNLPPENPIFTGRVTELEQLRKQLQETGTTAITQPVSISGLGGIGKTQLALAYAYGFYRKVYRVALWVNAASKETLQADYAELAEVLKLPERNEQKLELRIDAVTIWLKAHTNWLLIMDNADNLPLAHSFFPSGRHGHILLTTRSQSAGKIGASQLIIDKMTPEEGLEFILRRTHPDADTPDIHESALILVRLLDGHPLALDQAGAYIEETSGTFTEYINLYNERRRDFLAKRSALEDEQSKPPEDSDHPDSVFVTFDLCFTKARERRPLAAEILNFCAFLQPDAIPEELFQHDDSFKVDRDTFKGGIAALLRYSLIKRNRQKLTLSLHRLVQAVLIDGMPSDLQKQWRDRVVQALDATFPEFDFTVWGRCERLLPHVLVCAAWTEDELTSSEGIADLFEKEGIYLRARGQYSVAETLLMRVHPIYEQHFGAEHFRTVTALYGLAGLYFGQGNFGQAEPLLLQVHAMLERLFGANHLNTANCMITLAQLYLHQGKYDQAELLLEQLLSNQENHLGDEHPDISRCLSSLVQLYLVQGKYGHAEPYLERVFSLQVNHLGIEHPDTAKSLYFLAILSHKQGKYEQAELLYQLAISIV